MAWTRRVGWAWLTLAFGGLALAGSGRASGRSAQPIQLTFDHYHGLREVKALLDRWAAAYPTLARVRSIGKDFRGFDLWSLEITNQETGSGDMKPAFYADGNMDADEPSSTEVILELAHRLLTQYGKDPALTRLVDTTTFYLVPMSNPFMADLYVSTPMSGVVSSVNARPRDDDYDRKTDEDPPEDIDGDGHILTMRVRSPAGQFRTRPQEPRLLVRRAGNEHGEWTTYPEGLDNDGDGRINEDPIGGVDLNRNFPFDWQPESIQEGAGEHPLSEPEARSVAEFILAHPNIGIVINGHSGPDEGLVYRVYGSRSDSAIPQPDREAMSGFEQKFASLSGGLKFVAPYGEPALRRFGRPVYGHGFLIEWAYEMHGAFAFAPEHGMIPGDSNKDGAVNDDELLRLSDAEFGGRLFVPWKRFAHPTLGAVEIGGFVKFTKPNPPPGKYLESLVRTYADMYLYWASSLPRLVLRDASASAEAGAIVIRATIENGGALPTNVTTKSVDNHQAQAVIVTLTASPDVQMLGENVRQDLGHLRGTGVTAAPASPDARQLNWAVRTSTPGPHWVEITATSPKAGSVRKRIPLS